MFASEGGWRLFLCGTTSAPRAPAEAYIYSNSPCHCLINLRRELIRGKNHQASEKFHWEGTGNKQLPQSTVQVKLNWQEPLNPPLLLNTAKPFRVTEGWHGPVWGLRLPWAPWSVPPTSHTWYSKPPTSRDRKRSPTVFLTPLESLTRLFSISTCTHL